MYLMGIFKFITIFFVLSCLPLWANDSTLSKEFLDYSGKNFFEWLNRRFLPPPPPICTPTEFKIDENDWRISAQYMHIIRREKWGAIDLIRDEESFGCINYLNNLEAFASLRNKPVKDLSLKDIYQGGRIIIHHTAIKKLSINELDESAINLKKLVTVDYHFYITKDGVVYEGRPLFLAGAHAGADPRPRTCKGNLRQREFNFDYDFRSIGISLEGHYLNEDERKAYLRVGKFYARKHLKNKKLSQGQLASAQLLDLEVDKGVLTSRGIEKLLDLVANEKVEYEVFLGGLKDYKSNFLQVDLTSQESSQYLALKSLIKTLSGAFEIKDIVGHRHVRSSHTYCPGQALLDNLTKDVELTQDHQLQFYDHPPLNGLIPPYYCEYKSARCEGDWCDDNPEQCTRVEND